jgi:hypothetical protein
MCTPSWKLSVSAAGLLLLAFVSPRAEASVAAIGTGAFGSSSTLTTFTGLADFTEVNGLNVGGIVFNYSLGNGQVIIDGGPGDTNNISQPNIVSVGNQAGILTLTFPSSISMFGYGYAVLTTIPVLNATTIALFDGATNVGSLSYNGVPDPVFTGGFAGIESTIPFNRAEVIFNSIAAPAFALDNIRTSGSGGSAVPAHDPSTILLLGPVIGLLGFCRRRISSCRE